ncbi:MAG: isochorismate synthase [Deltaproteobacteria bacterium]|nr:isochorismate synthase [Deltaproteobacteria bacterium]
MNSIILNFDDAVNALKYLSAKATASMMCLRIKVSQKNIHSFSELFDDEKTVWIPGKDSTAHQPDWQITALGCAQEINCKKNTDFSKMLADASLVFSQLSVVSDAPAPHFPQLRFIGGAAFAPKSVEGRIWSDFGNARFVLPRWQYATQSGDATLQLVIGKDEFNQTEKWQRELHQIFFWLRQKETLKMPVTESVSITHYSNDWETLVNDALQEINKGHLQKVVVSRMSHLKSTLPFSLQRVLERLAASYANCTRFVVNNGEKVFVGATPEQLVRVTDSGRRISADALAGSAQRTGASDAGAMQLQHSEKERREFEFVLDNIESQLKKCGVRITSERDIQIKSLKNLYHLYCPVTGVADMPMHILQLVEQLHPTPAVCGTPTKPAAEWLIRHEHQPRGWYAGPVGWFDEEGNGCFAVGIRSALIHHDEAWLFAGAGIVKGSDAAVEFMETGAKLTPMLGALGAI